MKSWILLVFVVSIGVVSFAQTDSVSIVVHKDPRIDMLVKKQIEINEITTRNSRRSAPGYRIQVISTNNRNKALEAKTKIYQRFPELKTYLMYQSPFFRLKVGNFLDRQEAESYLQDILQLFPTGVYVVRDTVEVKPEKSTEMN
ncbi:MAG: SPOR domain-containing protein [Chitinophagaceae bacterium]|nr:SPOR domain-containing protein [Chitinophagaceae bacterium]